MAAPRSVILCAHGTRHPPGQRAVLRLAGAVAERFGQVRVRAAYLDVQEPHVHDVLAALEPESGSRDLDDGGAVLVPALLSTGYHVKTDLTRAAAAPGVVLAPPLGPDPRLADLLAERCREAAGDLRPGDAVILASAGSSDPEAGQSLAAAAELLATRLGRRVAAGNASGGHPRVSACVAEARAHRAERVIVVSYLLAPGFFADKLARCGADVVTAPLLHPDRTPDQIIDLVADRARLGRADRTDAPASQIIRIPSASSNLSLLGR